MGAWIPILGIIVGGLAVLGWIITETLKIKHGYKLDDGSTPVDAKAQQALVEENKQLRGQLDTVYDRLETLERIVTDKPSRLSEEIDALKSLPPRPAPTDEPDEKQ